MNHKAIYALYPTVVSVDDGTGAFDKDGNKVEIDLAAVNAWQDPDAYKYARAAEYPSFADQFDTIFHEGLDAWKVQIEAVKDKYPKGTE
jgi:hypothetical protein